MWVVGDQFFHRPWTVIDHFQEGGPSCRRHASQGAGNQVIDKTWCQVGSNGGIDVRIEDFQEVAELFTFGFFSKFFVALKGCQVLFQIVIKGY